MTRFKKAAFCLVLATTTIGGVSLAQTAQQAPSQPPPMSEEGQIQAERKRETATVEDIDRAKRRLTVRDQAGHSHTLTVGNEVKRFGEIKKGDRIDVDFYESVTTSFKKRPPGTELSAQETTVIEGEPGRLPGGMMARTLTRTAEVTKVDRAKGLVTFKAPDGERHTLHATDQAAMAQLGQVQKGDLIQVTYTEAIALAVEPPKKK